MPDVPATAPLVLLTVACGTSEERGCVERMHSEGCSIVARYASTTDLSRLRVVSLYEKRAVEQYYSSDGTFVPGWPRRDVSFLIRTIAGLL